MQSKPEWSDPAIAKYEYVSFHAAAAAAMELGCTGYHALPNGKFIPCKSISTLKKTVGIPPLEEIVLHSSNFETIDYSVYNWVDNIVNASTKTNEGFQKVPVIWLTAERAYQIKSNKERRQLNTDSLEFPLISIKRDSAEKAKSGERPIPGNLFKSQYAGRTYKANPYFVGQKINQDKTKNFANSTSLRLNGQLNFPTPPNQRIVYKRYWSPLPIYYKLSYSINIRTDYQQQMNEVLQPFAVYTDNINTFLIYSENHRYEAFIDDSLNLADNLDALGDEEKRYEAVIKMRVLGFVTGKGVNENVQKVSIRENLVKIRFPRERVILGDMYNYSSENEEGFYKP